MPKKKQVNKEVEERNEYQEQAQALEDKVASDFLGEDVEDGKVVSKEEPNEIEKHAEEIKEERETEPEKAETQPKEDAPDIDQIIEKASQKTAEETATRITQALNPQTKEDESETKKIVREFLSKSQSEGKTPTWEDAMEFLTEKSTELAIKRLEERQLQATQEQEAQLTAQKQAQEEATKKYNSFIDDQLNDLYRNNKLPKIKDKNDPSDIGVKSRQALFQTMLDVNIKRQQQGLSPITSVKEIFYEHYKPVDAQPAGADAPVSLGKGSVAPESEGEYSYRDIHNKSWFDLFRK